MSSHLKYMSYYYMLFIIEFIRVFFFFQAEDGIRDIGVTGVQTCAFLISSRRRHTRYWRDWSSDVCSSDLTGLPASPTMASEMPNSTATNSTCRMLSPTKGLTSVLGMMSIDRKSVV